MIKYNFLGLLILGVVAIMILKKARLSIIERMADLIEQWENLRTSRIDIGERYNNLGNVSWSGTPDTIPWAGAIGIGDQNIVVFETKQDGRNALIKQLELAFFNKSRIYNSLMSLREFFGKYAEDNSGNYAEFVAKGLGVSPDTTLEELKA